MGNFDSRRPGPEALTTEATTAESIVGTPRDHTSLRELVKNYGIPAALAVSALAGINGVARADAQEDTSAQKGYPGPSEENQGYPAPAGDTIDQEPTVDPAASATPSPTGEATLEAAQYEQWPAIYLPYGASDRPKGTPGATATAVEASPTATDVVPSPTHTDIPPTATTAPTNTAISPTPTELPIATETPEAAVTKEITFTGDETIFTSSDKYGPWGETDNLSLRGETGTIIGVNKNGVPVAIHGGTILAMPGYEVDTTGMSVASVPDRRIVMATVRNPYVIRDRVQKTEDYFVEPSYVKTDTSAPFAFGVSWNMGDNTLVRIDHTGSPRGLATFRETDTGFIVTQPETGKDIPITLSPNQNFSIRVSPDSAEHVLEIVTTDGSKETILGALVIPHLRDGVAHMAVRGDLTISQLEYSSQAVLDNEAPRGAYESRINSGIFAKTGVALGLSDVFGSNDDFLKIHGGVQALHDSLSPSQSDIFLDRTRNKIRQAEASGLRMNLEVWFGGSTFRGQTPTEVWNYVSTIRELAAGKEVDLSINMIDENGNLDIDPVVRTAFNIAKSDIEGGASLISTLAGQMGTLAQDGEQKLFVSNSTGMAGGTRNRIVGTLEGVNTALLGEGLKVEGVYFPTSENSLVEVSSVASALHAAGYFVGLQVWTDGRERLDLRSVGGLMKTGNINEIVFDPAYDSKNSSPIKELEVDGLTYQLANKNGAVPGTSFGNLLNVFDGQNLASNMKPLVQL